MMYCFFKRCYDNEEQFEQFHCFATLLKTGYSIVVKAMLDIWWGCGREGKLRTFSSKVEAAYALCANVVDICKSILVANEGQNSFGEVAGSFLSYVADFSDHNNFCYTCRHMGLNIVNNVFYSLTRPTAASPALATWISTSLTRPPPLHPARALSLRCQWAVHVQCRAPVSENLGCGHF